MPDINVSIANKIATLTNTPVIVCGNSDYEVKFTFDSEFSAYTNKTLRVVFREKGIEKHWDIVFQGDSVFLPPVYAVNAISIGVVCGNVISSTPIVIPCHYGDSAIHPDPPPDVYDQLLDLIEHIEPGGGGQAVLCDALICDQATDSGIAAVTSPYPPFSCDTGYYFDSKITCTIDGRIFTKTNNLPAIGVIIHFLNGQPWTQPLFISPIASAVIYITNYKSTYVYSEPIGSVDYDGITWYYCSLIYAMSGAYNDSEGHLLTYPELVTQQNNKVDPESVLEILQSVHAQKED